MSRGVPGLALAAVVIVGASISGQQLAEEQTRREALAYYRAGQELLLAERFEQAAEQFQRAIRKDPLLALAYYGLGQAYMGLRRYASAVVAYTDCREAYQRLAGLAQSDSISVDRQRDEEIRELRESIRQIQSGVIKVSQPGNLALKLEARVRELERMKQRSLDPARPPAEVSLALGSAHFRNGQLDEAEREWKDAVEGNSRLGEAHNNLAVLYMMRGRKKDAEEAIRAAERSGYRVNPNLKADIRNMGGH
jgi:Flp pilus assembly protein TadD